MRRAGKLALLALLIAAPVACGGSSEPTASRKAEAAEPEGPPVSEEGKKWGGWRWKGKRQDCFYVHENECFATQKDACRAAGCGVARCREREGTAPIKIRCAAEK